LSFTFHWPAGVHSKTISVLENGAVVVTAMISMAANVGGA
jgi:hypothetical protein